jgi:hypothetical protein
MKQTLPSSCTCQCHSTDTLRIDILAKMELIQEINKRGPRLKYAHAMSKRQLQDILIERLHITERF